MIENILMTFSTTIALIFAYSLWRVLWALLFDKGGDFPSFQAENKRLRELEESHAPRN